MYEKPPSDEELASLGLLKEDVEPAAIDVWQENQLALDAFLLMGSQWRVGMNGATGLDYCALPFVFKTLGVKKNKWGEILDDIRIMENTALSEMRKG